MYGLSGMASSFRLDDGQAGGRDPSDHVQLVGWERSITPVLCPIAVRERSLIRQSRLDFLPWPFKIRTMAIMVFQFRVVAGTPNSLSIWPR